MRGTRPIIPILIALFLLGVLAMAAIAGCNGQVSTPVPTPTAIAAPEGPDNPGVSDDRVLFGQSAAFEGPAQELGKNMRIGIEVAFAEANANGGVHGRRLELVSL